MNLNHKTDYQNGDLLTATAWNKLAADVNELGANTNENSESGSGLPNVYINDKGNLNIETSDTLGNTSKGKINIESMNDIQIKPTDDITLYSHHRANLDEVSVKILNGSKVSEHDGAEISEYPVDLLLNASNVILTTKDKGVTVAEKNKDRVNSGFDESKDKPNIMNVEIKTGVKKGKATAENGQYGYLKVRANAIDLRCEDHGGIAILPKGYDDNGNMNKIKFEHGGGDGLEFGTFNTEKSSLFTGEYRFNKNGEIYLATRQTEASDKTDDGVFDNNPTGKDATNAYKYVKQADDFYDVIDANDPHCTWGDIVTYIAWAKANNQGPWANA